MEEDLGRWDLLASEWRLVGVRSKVDLLQAKGDPEVMPSTSEKKVPLSMWDMTFYKRLWDIVILDFEVRFA